MNIRIEAKKFAKIEYASISLGDFLLFVGDNNSGKTLMMELIYGILNLIAVIPVNDYGTKISEMDDVTYIQFSSKWFENIESNINDYLRNNRKDFIIECFSKDIPVEDIKIYFEGKEQIFYIGTISETAYLEKQYSDGKRQTVVSNLRGTVKNLKLQLAKQVLLDMIGLNTEGEQIFLPAARAGLQMLYRSYFASSQGKSGIAMPVLDYLKFLQTYSPQIKITEEQEELIEFFEKQLLNGKVEYGNNEFIYKEGEHSIPLNMASSMIHELASLNSVLKSEKNFRYIFLDEAENSIHPIKQGEVARALIRLCNLNTKIIVSTHSDTMAGKINNLILVSKIRNISKRNRIIEKLNINIRDMIQKNKEVNVYEFKNTAEGIIVIEKLDFINYPKIGYEFERFNENIENLCIESNYIMGDDEDTET